MSKLRVTDRATYQTITWRVEDDESLYATADTYFVTCQETDIGEEWRIESDEEGLIDVESELGQEIKSLCETYEDFDMDGGYDG
jgi:hypothetical protein